MSRRTTQMDAYREWPLTKRDVPQWGRQRPYTAPSQPFIQTSSYKEEFAAPPWHKRVQPVRPGGPALRLGDQTSTPGSHYKEQFVPFTGGEPPRRYKVAQQYTPPKEPFIADTVYRDDFKGRFSTPPKKCIPGAQHDERVRFTVPENHESFNAGNAPTSRLAASAGLMSRSLDSGLSQMLEYTSDSGHLFYTRRSPCQTRTGLFEAAAMRNTRGMDPNKKPTGPRSRSQTPHRPASKSSNTGEQPQTRPTSSSSRSSKASTKKSSGKKGTASANENKAVPRPVPRPVSSKQTKEPATNSKESKQPESETNQETKPSEPPSSTGEQQIGSQAAETSNTTGPSDSTLPVKSTAITDPETTGNEPLTNTGQTEQDMFTDNPQKDSEAAQVSNTTGPSDNQLPVESASGTSPESMTTEPQTNTGRLEQDTSTDNTQLGSQPAENSTGQSDDQHPGESPINTDPAPIYESSVSNQSEKPDPEAQAEPAN